MTPTVNVSNTVATLLFIALGLAMLVLKAFAPSIPTNIAELVTGACGLLAFVFHIPTYSAASAQAKLARLSK